ncbi:MAG: hypothetical protein AUG08_11845 [Acidobacteria bacterium 13_1_20CM_2_55_15]|nr:MAG: hypothetical protein AUI91_01905 [Acidobacteria bacterium 13_1_40CM_3_56_11]OLE87434.1 MAG: hypothetical protein AUG08_11845 [Acidobacteria bacterium 13_1_20CM_2_55_15]PYR67826.1 MAG: hypothetical protein DMG20_10490 [Acidobacteriota bacterium]
MPSFGTGVPKAATTCANLGNALPSFGHNRAQTQKQMADLSSGQAIKTIKIRKLHALDIWPILHFSP